MERFEKTDLEFHFVLGHVAGNPIFPIVHQAVVGWLTNQRTVSLTQPEAAQSAFDYHQRIFDAVLAKDPDRAEREMWDHLTNVERLYWKSLVSEGAADGSSEP
jgi:GntR family transcriptional repressor for pyruvate dehydrogenase complex